MVKNKTIRKIGQFLKWGSFGLIWIGSHLFILLKGMEPEMVKAHAILNLSGVAIYAVGYWLEERY